MDPQYFNFSNFSNSGVGRGFSYTPSSANEGANSKTPANIGAIGAGMALQSLTSPAASFTSNVGVSSGPGSGITPSISQLGYSAAGTGIAVPSSASGFDPPGASGRASNLVTATTSRVGMAGAPGVTALAGATFGAGPSSLTSPRLNSLTSKPLSPSTASFFDTSSANPGNGASSLDLSRVTTPTTTATAPKPFDPSSYYSMQQQRTLKSSSPVSLHSLTSPSSQSAVPQSKPHFSCFGNSAPSTSGGNSTVSFQFKAPFQSFQRQTASSGYDATAWASGGSETSGGGGSRGSLGTPGSSRSGSLSGPSGSTYFPSTLTSSQYYANNTASSAGASTTYRHTVPASSSSDLGIYTSTAVVGGTPRVNVTSFAGNNNTTADSVTDPYNYGATQQQQKMYMHATPASAGSMAPSYRSNSLPSLQSLNFGANSWGTGYSTNDESVGNSYKNSSPMLQQQQQQYSYQPQRSVSTSGSLVSSWAQSPSKSLSSFSAQQYQQHAVQQEQQQNSQTHEEIRAQRQALVKAHMKVQTEYNEALARAETQSQPLVQVQAESQVSSYAQKQQQQQRRQEQQLQYLQHYQRDREAQTQQHHQTTPLISSHNPRQQSQPNRMTVSSGTSSFYGDTSNANPTSGSSSAPSVSFTAAPTTASSTLTIPEEDEDIAGESNDRASIRMMRKNHEIEALQAEVKRLGSLLADRKSASEKFDRTAYYLADDDSGNLSSFMSTALVETTPMLPSTALNIVLRSGALIDPALPSPADSEYKNETSTISISDLGVVLFSEENSTFSTDMAFRQMAKALDQMKTKNEKLQLRLKTTLAKLDMAQTSSDDSPSFSGRGDSDELMDRAFDRIAALQDENEVLEKLTYQGRVALKEAEVLAIKRENAALRKENGTLQSVAERLRKELECRFSTPSDNKNHTLNTAEDLPSSSHSRRRGANQDKRSTAAEQSTATRSANTGVTASLAGLRVSESAGSNTGSGQRKKKI